MAGWSALLFGTVLVLLFVRSKSIRDKEYGILFCYLEISDSR